MIVADPELQARYNRWSGDLIEGLTGIYDLDSILPRIHRIIDDAHAARPSELRARDRQRVLMPDWFQRPDQIGYVAYADRFAGDLTGVRGRIDYLTDLHVTYLHLMPLLTPRSGANDGGYAVADYRSVRADLGTIEDLRVLATDLHAAGISLTLDLVLNHVAEEHAWARAARTGSARHRDYFYVYPDRVVPDQFERSLPEVFPAFAPGNFTWDDDLHGWVWTTFNEWQWDLNWSNPDVFCEFAEIILFLANLGVDCLRLDAIAFIWKRMGTNCQNQPEVHLITQALRAITRIAAPATVFKAEAIVSPTDLVAYLGQGPRAGKVSDLAYHNSLMVQIWSALAARDGRLLAAALHRFPAVPTTSAWGTYLRCHDDIGWAIEDADAQSVGWDGAGHRRFLSDFYAGEFTGTFARGAVFQPNELTGDRRISGSAASLAGIEAAVESGSPDALDTAIDRLLCAYAMVLGFGGIPLIYMGDEIALLNDEDFALVPEHADDNRWLHRPTMPWERVTSDPVSRRIRARFIHLIETRLALPSLHASVTTRVRITEDPAVILFERQHAAGTLVQVYNLSERQAAVRMADITATGITSPWDQLARTAVKDVGGWVRVPAYAALWLTDAPEAHPLRSRP